jgi:hypothetical protein
MMPTGWAPYQELRGQIDESVAITIGQVPAIVDARPVHLFPSEAPVRHWRARWLSCRCAVRRAFWAVSPIGASIILLSFSCMDLE